eukprot:8126758-Heterocapsa_arctica.AAC.1
MAPMPPEWRQSHAPPRRRRQAADSAASGRLGARCAVSEAAPAASRLPRARWCSAPGPWSCAPSGVLRWSPLAVATALGKRVGWTTPRCAPFLEQGRGAP